MSTTTRATKARTSRRTSTPVAAGASLDAKRRAALILEVLAGVRSPTEAAAGLGVSVPRYYLLEQQALTGLVTACEPKPRGRASTAAREVADLRRQVQRLQRECARQQALARAGQRSLGLTAPEPPKGKPPPQGKRRRRPTVRALQAAARLHSGETLSPAPPVVPSHGAGAAGESVLTE